MVVGYVGMHKSEQSLYKKQSLITCFLTTFHIRLFRFRTEIDFYMRQLSIFSHAMFFFLFTWLVFLNDVYSFKKRNLALERSNKKIFLDARMTKLPIFLYE